MRSVYEVLTVAHHIKALRARGFKWCANGDLIKDATQDSRVPLTRYYRLSGETFETWLVTERGEIKYRHFVDF